MEDAELARAIRAHAYLEGDFLLRSGRRSRYYLDKYRFETRPDLLGPIGERIAELVRSEEPDASRLAGPELGAVALAAAASLSSGVPFLIVRKERKDYATANRIEGPFDAGERACVVEDVVTTAGSTRETIAVAEQHGATVVGACSIVDRSGGTHGLQLPYAALLPMNLPTYKEDECPLCKQGVPVVKPGSRRVGA